MSKIIQCDNPPGGTLTCDDWQLGICGTQGGQLVVGCFEPPPGLHAMVPTRRNIELRRWAVQKITGGRRLSPVQERQLLSRGRFSTPDGSFNLRFVLPSSIRVARKTKKARRPDNYGKSF